MAATKSDLETLGESLRGEIRAMEGRLNERIDLKVAASANQVIGTLSQEMAAQTRLLVFSMVTALATVGGLAVAAGGFG